MQLFVCWRDSIAMPSAWAVWRGLMAVMLVIT